MRRRPLFFAGVCSCKGGAAVFHRRRDEGKAHARTDACVAVEHDRMDAALLRLAGWLTLVAAPTFALMALLTGVAGDDPIAMLCSAAHGGSPLSGMPLMYALMSVFHSGAWLRLVVARRRHAGRLR